jgi:uncharacterized protein YggE
MSNVFSNRYLLGAIAALVLGVAYYGFQSSSTEEASDVATTTTSTEGESPEATNTAEVSNSTENTDESNTQEEAVNKNAETTTPTE